MPDVLRSSGERTQPRYSHNLTDFGGIGIIMSRGEKYKSKIMNSGKKAMMAGYNKQAAY